VIRGFKHKGLAKFFETGSKVGVQAQHGERLRLILGRLRAATAPRDIALPGLDLHPLKGERKGTWAVSVSGNWRVTFTRLFALSHSASPLREPQKLWE
jgi:proteic killer suppression protein